MNTYHPDGTRVINQVSPPYAILKPGESWPYVPPQPQPQEVVRFRADQVNAINFSPLDPDTISRTRAMHGPTLPNAAQLFGKPAYVEAVVPATRVAENPDNWTKKPPLIGQSDYVDLTLQNILSGESTIVRSFQQLVNYFTWTLPQP